MLLLVVSSRILCRDAQSTSKARVPKRSYANFSPSCPQPSSSGSSSTVSHNRPPSYKQVREQNQYDEDRDNHRLKRELRNPTACARR